MVLSKALLLKCLGGLAACAVPVVGLGIKNDWWQNSNPQPQEGDPTDTDLISKVGLNCTGNGNEECSIKTEGLKIKQGNNKEENKTKSTGGIIKLYKGKEYSDYNRKMKFTIENGDITFNSSEQSTQITKLEQFETYEIEEVDEAGTKKYYLKRKHTAIQEKEIILGLPTGCKLPENNESCTNVSLTDETLKQLNFEGKTSSSQASLTSGATVTLSITKETVDTDVFTDGYKFSFTTTNGTVSVPSTTGLITLEANKATEFKIKKTESKLSLEKAWTLENLTKKVGLKCNTDSSCNKKTSETTTIKIKQGNDIYNTQTLTIPDSGSGKIKVYTTEATNYNEGFKFVIEGGDITFNNDKKLEEEDTYEIKKENNEWYFLRKTESESKKIRKALGLPEGCKLPKEENNPITCEGTDVDKLKAIKFEGKDINGSWTIGEGTKLDLKITKTSDTTTFPKGYRFAFEGDKEISIPLTSNGSITLKKNTNTEFKIKVSDSESFSLEKAWNINTLSAKINLSGCTASSGDKKQCGFGERINLFNSESSSITEAKVVNNEDNKKITYEEGQEGYNQGFKFSLEENIPIQGDETSKSVAQPAIGMIDANSSSGGQKPTYEIKEQTVNNVTNWYLSKYTAPAS